MKIFKKFLVTAAALLFVLNSLSCHGRTRSKRRSFILGFSQIGTESAWRNRNTTSILEAAREADIQVLYDDAQQKQENQLKALRSFIVYQVDVIAFVPIVEEGWDNILREAKEAHIPVIVVDRKIKTSDENLYVAYIGEDGKEEGRKAGEFLLEKYPGRSRNINIALIQGTEFSSVARDRTAGFMEAIGDEKRFNIIHNEYGDFLRSRGKEIADSFESRNGKLYAGGKIIDVIFSQNDAMTLGVLESLENRGINSGKDVTIISIDGEQKSIDALREGKLNCVVECNPNTGPELIHLVKTLMNRNTVPKETYIPEGVFTENDDMNGIPLRGY